MKPMSGVRGALSLASLVLLGLTVIVACGESRWRLVSSESHTHSPEFVSLFFADSVHGWGLTPVQLLETSDGGKTWVERLGSDDSSFYSMQFVSQSIGFVVGGRRKVGHREALILRTDDGGKTWREIALNLPAAAGNRTIYSISFCNAQIGWAVGTDMVLQTTDNGQSWQVQRSNNGEMLLGVSCLSLERASVIGQDGLVLQTTDSGKSWSRQTSGTTDNLTRVRFFGNDGWILGGAPGKSLLLRTRDAGTSWERKELNSSEPLFDLNVNGTQGWIVGAAGTILESSDGGQTWTRQEGPTNNDLTCLFFLSSRRGWAGGDKRTVLLLSQ